MPRIEFGVWDQMQTYETHIRHAQLAERVGLGCYWPMEHQDS